MGLALCRAVLGAIFLKAAIWVLKQRQSGKKSIIFSDFS
jgi:hypothetical protein